MGKNSKKHEKFSKKPSFLVFADFHAEGVYGGTFCIKGESKLRTQWFIIAIFKKIYGLVFGWFSGKKRGNFLVFCKNPPNGEKYGKVIKMFFEEFAKTFHHVKFFENPSTDGWEIQCSKNGPFSLADFYKNEFADFFKIFSRPTLGPLIFLTLFFIALGATV